MDRFYDNLDDAALVALALEGEREAFSALLLRHYDGLARLCRRLLGYGPEAQDVAQEAALQAFLGLARLREPARFGAWLHAIGANLARMILRRRRPLSLDALGDGARPARLTPTPEDAQAARELHDAIVVALNDLSTVNREVAIHFYLEGYSYSELAELLGVPVGTVKGRLFKGRQQLRQALGPLAREALRPDRRARKERTMEPPDLVEVTIDSIRRSIPAHHRVVVLREANAGQVLPIWIGTFEADAIALALDGKQPARPMTHDLTLRLLETLGAQVRRVVVQKLIENTFYAEIELALGEQTYRIDARPSDALALAARVSAPIFVARSLLEQAGAAVSSELFALMAQLDAFAATDTKLLPFALQVEWPDWPDRLPTQTLEWDGQPMLAVHLPGAGEPEWLLLRPALWERVATLGQQLREHHEAYERGACAPDPQTQTTPGESAGAP